MIGPRGKGGGPWALGPRGEGASPGLLPFSTTRFPCPGFSSHRDPRDYNPLLTILGLPCRACCGGGHAGSLDRGRRAAKRGPPPRPQHRLACPSPRYALCPFATMDGLNVGCRGRSCLLRQLIPMWRCSHLYPLVAAPFHLAMCRDAAALACVCKDAAGAFLTSKWRSAVRVGRCGLVWGCRPFVSRRCPHPPPLQTKASARTCTR